MKLGATTPTVLRGTYISASDIANVFNAVSEESGVTAVAKNEATFSIATTSATVTDAATNGTLVVNGVTTSLTSNMALSTLVASLNLNHQTNATGLVFTQNGNEITVSSDRAQRSQ